MKHQHQIVIVGASLLAARASHGFHGMRASLAEGVARRAAVTAVMARHRQAQAQARIDTEEVKFLRLRAERAAEKSALLSFQAQQKEAAAMLLTHAVARAQQQLAANYGRAQILDVNDNPEPLAGLGVPA
jgi:hypothetical protein